MEKKTWMMAVTQNNHDVRLFFLGWEFLLFRTGSWLKKNILLDAWRYRRFSVLWRYQLGTRNPFNKAFVMLDWHLGWYRRNERKFPAIFNPPNDNTKGNTVGEIPKGHPSSLPHINGFVVLFVSTRHFQQTQLLCGIMCLHQDDKWMFVSLVWSKTYRLPKEKIWTPYFITLGVIAIMNVIAPPHYGKQIHSMSFGDILEKPTCIQNVF